MPRKRKEETTVIANVKEPIVKLSPLDEVKKYGRKAQGKKELEEWLTTKKPLTRTAAIKAYCYSCTGYCADYIGDCGCKDCPLYPYMPYASVVKEPQQKKKRVLSPEHIAKLIAARKKKD